MAVRMALPHRGPRAIAAHLFSPIPLRHLERGQGIRLHGISTDVLGLGADAPVVRRLGERLAL